MWNVLKDVGVSIFNELRIFLFLFLYYLKFLYDLLIYINYIVLGIGEIVRDG